MSVLGEGCLQRAASPTNYQKNPHACLEWSLLAVTAQKDVYLSMGMLFYSVSAMCQDGQKLISKRDCSLGFFFFAFQDICSFFSVMFAFGITGIGHSKSLWSVATPLSLSMFLGSYSHILETVIYTWFISSE